MCIGNGPVDGAQLSASLIEGGTGSETAKEFRHAVEAASDHGCREVVRAGDDVGHDFGILGIGDGGFEAADDGGRSIAHGTPDEAKGFAHDARIFPKSGCTETIGENDYTGSFGTVVLRSDERAENRVQAHDFEIVAADDARLNYARLAQADHGELEGRELAERAQGFDAAAQILDFGNGEVCVLVAGARGALA